MVDFESMYSSCCRGDFLTEDGAIFVNFLKPNNKNLSASQKATRRVRFGRNPRKIPSEITLTEEEIGKCFYTQEDEYAFVLEREAIANAFPMKKEGGILLDPSDNISLRGLEDRLLPKSRHIRRAEHSYRVLEGHCSRHGNLADVAVDSSHDDAMRAVEIAQQDTLAAIEAMVGSYTELVEMDANIVPILRERVRATRSQIQRKAGINRETK